MLDTVRDATLAHPTRTLGAARLAIGASGWATPGLMWSVAGMGSPESPSSVVMTRMFAARELALGAGALHPDPTVRRVTLQVGLVVDSLDALAYAVAVRAGAPRASLASAALALSAVAGGLVALREA